MAQRTGTIQLSGPVDPSVFSQPFTITGSTVAGLATQNIDLMNPASNSFQANDGDVLTESGTQVNHTGASPVSAPITIVVAAGVVSPGAPPPPPAVPVAPVIGTNTFV
jgi:hypothetical protein